MSPKNLIATAAIALCSIAIGIGLADQLREFFVS